MNDILTRAVSVSGGIRMLACTVSHLARHICELQDTSYTVSVALGRGLASGALMGAMLKPGQRVALKFEGNGPMGKMIIEADSDGAVRGCVGNPAAEADPTNGSWNVPGVLGQAGFLTVTRDLGLGGEPYRGLVQLRTSEIGDDLAYYLTDSEQVPSAVGLSTALDSQGRIEVCGGFLVQALPTAEEPEIGAITETIGNMAPLAELLREGGPQLVVERLFGDIPFTMLRSTPSFFRCGCSKEKVERALLSLGVHELEEMREKEQGTTVTCEFCRQSYDFDIAGLNLLINQCRAASGS